jgi:hypothetical protein
MSLGMQFFVRNRGVSLASMGMSETLNRGDLRRTPQ